MNLFKSCVEIIEDKDAVAELSALVKERQPSVRLENKFNHIGKRPKIGHELRMNAHICSPQGCRLTGKCRVNEGML